MDLKKTEEDKPEQYHCNLAYAIQKITEDAYKCFMRTEMDYLVLGNFNFSKKEQPQWHEKEEWKKEFVLD